MPEVYVRKKRSDVLKNETRILETLGSEDAWNAMRPLAVFTIN